MEAFDRHTLLRILSMISQLLHDRPKQTDHDFQYLKDIEPSLMVFHDYIDNDPEHKPERGRIIEDIASHCLEPMFSSNIGQQLEGVNSSLPNEVPYPRLQAVLSTYELPNGQKALRETLVPFSSNGERWKSVISNMIRTAEDIQSEIRYPWTAPHIPGETTRIGKVAVEHIQRVSDLCDQIHSSLDCTCSDLQFENPECSARLRLELWGGLNMDEAYETTVVVKERGVWNELLISSLQPNPSEAGADSASGLLCGLLKQNDSPQTRSQKLLLRPGSPELDRVRFAERQTNIGLGKEMTLGELIDEKKGTKWMTATKLMLGYTLSSCLCYLHGGSWTQGGLNSSTIVLAGDGVSIHPKPFLNTTRRSIFRSNAELSTSQTRKKTTFHRFPDIFELGWTLLELELGRTLEAPGSLDPFHSVTSAYRKLAGDAHPWAAMDAIHACLVEFNSDSYPSSPVSDVRQDILMKVVQPFERDFEKTQQYRQLKAAASASISEKIATATELVIGTPSDREALSQRGSKLWQEDFEMKWVELAQCYSGSSLPRIKVALLDSGINMEHPAFQRKDLKDRIREHYSWVDAQPLTDSCGHGTHIAHTILRLSYNVELYIGKITTNDMSSTAEVNNADAIVESLRHAREVWQVDMISLSFAFKGSEKDEKDIVRELKDCWKKQIAVFAAASNDGIDNPRAFPASSNQVLCIHAGLHNGTAHECNPQTQDEKDNFLVLGCDIYSAWLNRTRRHKTGTSFAVPVAICIAAFMIAYLERHAEDSQEWLTQPKTANGVHNMFKIMAVGSRSAGFSWISPSGYLKGKSPQDVVSSMMAKLDGFD